MSKNSIIVVACLDWGAGIDPEAFGLINWIAERISSINWTVLLVSAWLESISDPSCLWGEGQWWKRMLRGWQGPKAGREVRCGEGEQEGGGWGGVDGNGEGETGRGNLEGGQWGGGDREGESGRRQRGGGDGRGAIGTGRGWQWGGERDSYKHMECLGGMRLQSFLTNGYFVYPCNAGYPS